MSINIPGSTSPTTDCSDFTKNQLVAIVQKQSDIIQESDIIQDLQDEISDIRDELATRAHRSAKTRKNISENDERLSDVEDKLDDTDVSQSSEGQSSPDEGQESTGQSTALEQVVGLPEETAMNSLSANQKRARSIAKRIDEYGKSVPAGIAITSSRMRDILSGLEDKRVHRQTVQRVMDFVISTPKKLVEARQ
jgi:chemotaxis regulatin CheY-phosphate phosphatase CheZ